MKADKAQKGKCKKKKKHNKTWENVHSFQGQPPPTPAQVVLMTLRNHTASLAYHFHL